MCLIPAPLSLVDLEGVTHWDVDTCMCKSIES